MWNNICQCESEKPIKHRVCKQEYVWNPSTCASEIDEYLKRYTSCADIIDAVAKLGGVTPETVSIGSDNKRATYKMNYYILYKFLLVTILLLKIIIICYYPLKYRPKQKKNYFHINNMKMERNNEL